MDHPGKIVTNMKKEQPIIEEVEELDLEKELAFLEAQEKDEHHD